MCRAISLTVFATLTVLLSGHAKLSHERSHSLIFSGKLKNHLTRHPKNWTRWHDHLETKDRYEIWKSNDFDRQLKIYVLGLFLSDDHPAHYVALFNKQTTEANQLALFAYAALEESILLSKKIKKDSNSLGSILESNRTFFNEQCPRKGTPDCPSFSLIYRTADGTCNNLQNPWWGSSMSTMIRFLPAVYHDGIQEIRRSVRNNNRLPSPRDISRIVHEDVNVPLDTVSHMLMQWGQFVDHDITATAQSTGFNGVFPQCCLGGGVGFQPPELMHPDCLPIAVSQEDSFLGPLGVKCLEFVRSSPAPRENCSLGYREQLSQVTSFLDGSMIYASNERHADSLRLFEDGLLIYGTNEARKPSLPFEATDFFCRQGFVSTKCFKAGDGRLSEQPALMTLHIVFLRLHNGLARKLGSINAHWSDERLYQEARRIVGALVQLITYREYLPIILGNNIVKIFDLEIHRDGFYHGYDTRVNPTIVNSFSTAAYRFGHSLVQKSFNRFNERHKKVFDNVTIHNEFSNRENLQKPEAVDELLLGLVNQPCQRGDEFLTSELTNHLFQTSKFKFGMDLASINIQRGRDHGIPPYAHWRTTCGLTRVANWLDFERITSPSATRKFRKVYASVKDVDLFSAGLAEKPVRGGLVGPTFACIIAQQFSNLRKGDRFWFENGNQENSFTFSQLRQIKSITLADILCQTTDKIQSIQPFVLLMPDTFKNKRISCDETFGKFNLDAWKEHFPSPLE